MSPMPAQAVEEEVPPSHVTITVVMPDNTQTQEPQTVAQPAPQPSMPDPDPYAAKLYPISVDEVFDGGERWVIKSYELGASDNPADIPRGSFERGGWAYSLVDIIKKETAYAVTRDHMEIATIETETKDMEDILRQLDPSMEYKSEDGFSGVLSLDISSIAVESAGTRTTSYTASAVREYPHLSSNDTSLVPKTITDGGRTMSLSSVNWRPQSTETVDYEQIPVSYSAVATYTATASVTAVTGYITTAEYKGAISRLDQGLTIYTAYFIGTEAEPEMIPLEIISPAPDAGPDEDMETDTAAESGDEDETADEPDSGNAGSTMPALIPVAILALLLGAGGGYYIPRILKNRKPKGDADK